MLYGWKPEYIGNTFSLDEISKLYSIGIEIDLWRRGWDIKRNEKISEETREELHDIYYTEEEKKELEKYLNKAE